MIGGKSDDEDEQEEDDYEEKDEDEYEEELNQPEPKGSAGAGDDWGEVG